MFQQARSRARVWQCFENRQLKPHPAMPLREPSPAPGAKCTAAAPRCAGVRYPPLVPGAVLGEAAASKRPAVCRTVCRSRCGLGRPEGPTHRPATDCDRPANQHAGMNESRNLLGQLTASVSFYKHQVPPGTLFLLRFLVSWFAREQAALIECKTMEDVFVN